MMVTLVTSSCLEKEEMANQVRIYYVPIGAETYIPITVENIETSYVRYGEVDIIDRNFKKLLDMIDKAKSGDFETGMLRVKVVFPDNQLLYIDNYGGISFKATDNLKLTGSHLNKVKKILEGLTSFRDN